LNHEVNPLKECVSERTSFGKCPGYFQKFLKTRIAAEFFVRNDEIDTVVYGRENLIERINGDGAIAQ
jgi:hypothetical protein